jgi:hypothetical protein
MINLAKTFPPDCRNSRTDGKAAKTSVRAFIYAARGPKICQATPLNSAAGINHVHRSVFASAGQRGACGAGGNSWTASAAHGMVAMHFN